MEPKIIALKNKLKREKIRGLALDIDETLANTYIYWATELFKTYGNPDNFTPEQLYKKYRRIQDYPAWKKKEINEWINLAIHKDELQPQLPLIENSNKIVNKVNKIIPVCAYISARPTQVTAGTKTWLDSHRFPKAPLITSNTFQGLKDSSKWKASVLEYLYPYVQGIVDDNASLVDHLSPDYKGTIFIYNHPSFRATRKNVISCGSWEEVLKQVKTIFT